MTVWVTGSRGMLGTEVCLTLGAAGHRVIATDCELDITEAELVTAHFASETGIAWVVNCAAYTAVDAAQDDEVAAHKLNAVGPEILAEAGKRVGARILHISTDYVFDGLSDSPYKPTDRSNPTGVYGSTKLEGERAIQAICDNAVILRTAWLYGKAGENFVSTMIRLMSERQSLTVVDDQRGSPTYTRDVSAVIRAVIETRPTPGGIYHYTGAGQTTWYGFACEIYNRARYRGLIEGRCDLRPTTTKAYGAKTPRPAYSVLDCSDSERIFHVNRRDWQESLEDYLEELTT